MAAGEAPAAVCRWLELARRELSARYRGKTASSHWRAWRMSLLIAGVAARAWPGVRRAGRFDASSFASRAYWPEWRSLGTSGLVTGITVTR